MIKIPTRSPENITQRDGVISCICARRNSNIATIQLLTLDPHGCSLEVHAKVQAPIKPMKTWYNDNTSSRYITL